MRFIQRVHQELSIIELAHREELQHLIVLQHIIIIIMVQQQEELLL